MSDAVSSLPPRSFHYSINVWNPLPVLTISGKIDDCRARLYFLTFVLSIIERFIGRFRVVMPLIIVPIDRKCARRCVRDGDAFSECPFSEFCKQQMQHIWYLRAVHGPQANVNGFKLQSAIHSAPRRLGEKVLGENWIIESLVNGHGCVNEFCMQSLLKV